MGDCKEVMGEALGETLGLGLGRARARGQGARAK